MITIAALAAWLVTLALLCVALLFALATPGIKVTAGQSPLLEQLTGFGPMLFAYATVGALLAARRPRNPIGWLFLFAALCGAGGMAGAGYCVSMRGTTEPALPYINWIGRQLGNGMFVPMVLVLALFPSGTLRSRLERVAARTTLLTAVLQAGAQAVLVTVQGESGTRNPFAISALAPLYGPVEAAAQFTFALAFLLSCASVVARYRSGTRTERSQMQWLLYASLLLVATIIGLLIIGESGDPTLSNLGYFIFLAALAFIPVAVAIAILRHRLYDIDLLINRTFVYGATTAVVAGTFWVGILALQRFLSPITSGSEAAIAASTLVSLALFQPIRRRVQDAVDRRFDRSRYNASRTLDSFVDQLRDEVELDLLQADLIGAVRQTMSPTHASLWLRARPK